MSLAPIRPAPPAAARSGPARVLDVVVSAWWGQAVIAVLAGGVVGLLLGTGDPTLAVAAAGLVVVVLSVLVARRSPVALPLLAVVLACLPETVWFTFRLGLGGKTLYFSDLLLPLAALLALTRRSRVPRADLVVWVYVAMMGLQSAAGVVNGEPFNAFAQDLRGPVYIVCGYLVASRVFVPRHTRHVLTAAGVVLWYSTALMLVTIATGVETLAGRTEDVRAFAPGGAEVIDATRFVVDSKGLAFIVLVTSTVVLVSRSASRAQRCAAVVLLVPAFLVTFLNYARATVLAAVICLLLLAMLQRTARVHRRRVAVAALVVAGAVGAVGVTGTAAVLVDPEGNVVARQVAGFSERVIGGLQTEDVESPGNTYRLLENRAAVEGAARNPLFGLGIGAAFKPRSFGDPALDAFQQDPAFGVRFIHNGWLWYLVKTGAVGVAVFTVLALRPVVTLVRGAVRRREPIPPGRLGLALSVVGLLVIFVFEPDIHRTGTAPLFGAVLGYLSLAAAGTLHSPARHGPALTQHATEVVR